MAKNREIVELNGASPNCPAPVPSPALDNRQRRLRQDCEVRSVALRAQVLQSRPECELPLGDVTAPPVAEPVIESAGSQPQVVIGQAGAATTTGTADMEASSLLQRFMAVLAIGEQDGEQRSADDERIIGSGDRAHHLALIAGAPAPAPQPLRPAREPLIARAAPKSRADCRRRCGRNGFCDPSSDLGCGGVHCGNPIMREAL